MNVLTHDGKLTKSSTTAAKSLRQGEAAKVLPFFERGNDTKPIGTSDIFYLKLKTAEDIALLSRLASQLKVQVIKEVPYTPLWYVLSIRGSDFGSSVEASNYFYETGDFADVDPAFMFEFKDNSLPNDPMFHQLWGLRNTSYPGIDIDVVDAWDISRGRGVVVAVVDRGIDRNHDDLAANMHALSFNVASGASPSGYEPWNSHGTLSAGVVAAVGNNNKQVIGVAHEAKIMGVSHNGYDWRPSTYSTDLASGINWAWRNGADIITNSWGDADGIYDLHSAILEEAIIDAMTKGRSNNKGCVVVFAAGNIASRLDYPANFHPDILTVGSIIQEGRQFSSGIGPELDVVAPGSYVLSTASENGVGFGDGSSIAAPHVAGVAALILSAYPNLTQKQVVDRIERSARKIRTDLYDYRITPSRPNGSWHEKVGYGLVNAYAALNDTPARPALATPVISVEIVPRSTSNRMDAVFSVDNPQPGVTYQWELNGTIVSSVSTPYIAFLSTLIAAHADPQPTIRATLRCKASSNGTFSPWSNSVFTFVESLTTVSYRP